MVQKRSRTVSAPSWQESKSVCTYADGDRHLGHIVRASDGWIAFDATHSNTQGNSFRPLGFFPSIEAAREAVQLATASYREMVV